MKRSIAKLTALLAAGAMVLTGCGGNRSQTVDLNLDEVSIREAVTVADPTAAIQEVYDMLPDARVEPLTQSLFRELFSDLEVSVDKYYGNISNPSGGLSDMVIIRPAEDTGGNGKKNRDAVRDALLRYQNNRIQEFENYDILHSFSIATEAEVYDQGDYVILLMLADNEVAREIVDAYIPM